jgi:hypothetical protein
LGSDRRNNYIWFRNNYLFCIEQLLASYSNGIKFLPSILAVESLNRTGIPGIVRVPIPPLAVTVEPVALPAQLTSVIDGGSGDTAGV